VLTGAAALATSSLAAGSASAKSGISGEDVPVPNVKGPIVGGEATGEPQTASVPDLSEYGYIEEAYFISGEARALGHAELFAEEWEEPPNESAEYTTRLLIFRPEDPADFNGGVVVNWPNVSDDHDVPFVWFNVYDYVVREGYAFAIASSQKIGVDEYSYDMFSQAVQALREHPDPDPMGGLETTRVLATGISQSAIYFRYYISEVQGNCLVQHLLSRSSSVERLIRSIVVIVVSEPSQPAPSAGWTPPPERVKAIDPHRDRLKPLFDAIPFAVVELPAQLLTSERCQIPTGIDEKVGI
jgi:hypothetical protein